MPHPPRASWTRHPATFAAGAAVLVIFGVIIGVNAGRFTERDETFTPPGARIPVPGPPAVAGGAAHGPPRAGQADPARDAGRHAAGRPPEPLRGPLLGGHRRLPGRAQARRAQRGRDDPPGPHRRGRRPRRLRARDLRQALKIDPKYAPAYLYRGQVLYEQKQDYAGAVAAWERFMALVPKGEDRDRVAELVARAKNKQPAAIGRWSSLARRRRSSSMVRTVCQGTAPRDSPRH